MQPYQFHFFQKSEPASISFHADVTKEDMVFLFLVFIYSETRRQDRARVCPVVFNSLVLPTNIIILNAAT